MGINQFAIYSEEEFLNIFLSPVPMRARYNERDSPMHKINSTENIDWTTKGAISPVRDQGNCYSSWAFTAVSALESYSYLKGKEIDLS